MTATRAKLGIGDDRLQVVQCIFGRESFSYIVICLRELTVISDRFRAAVQLA